MEAAVEDDQGHDESNDDEEDVPDLESAADVSFQPLVWLRLASQW